MEIGFTNRPHRHPANEACSKCGGRCTGGMLVRCDECLDRAADAKRRPLARELAVRAVAETLGFRAHRVLRAVVAVCDVAPTYLSLHGELGTLRQLAKLGLVRCVAERVSRSPVASSRAWVPTEDGRAIAAYRQLAGYRSANVRAVA